MPGDVYEINDIEQFKAFINTHRFVVVKITATWCGPCKKAEPILKSEFQTMGNNVYLVYVDADKGTAIKRAFRIKTVPTFASIIDGELCDIYQTSSKEGIGEFFVKMRERVLNAMGN